MQNVRITEISVEEFDFLTDYVDLSGGQVKDGAKYLIYNRQKKLIEIVRSVMQNELTEYERNLATAHWCNEVSLRDLAKTYGVSYASVYRSLENIRKKLETALKYVLMYDKILLPQSSEELLEYVRKCQN